MKYQSNSSKHLIPIVVGVTGHRDLREEDIPELEKNVEAIFKEIRNKYKGKGKYQSPPITILSPLAEGADRLVARVGLHAGHAEVKLTAILPMPKEEYEKDFDTAGSKREFADLLEKAEDVFELPFIEGNTLEKVRGCKESRNKQYALAGAYIAAHSQILIALWDGGATSETAEVVRAKLEGIPAPSAPPESPLDILDNGPVYHIFTRRKNTPPETAAYNHEPGIPCLLHSKGEWDALYPIIWNTDKHVLPESDKGKSSDNKPEDAAERYYVRVLKRISEFNRDIMNWKNEHALKESMSHVMPESEQGKLSPGLRKILACYGYADTLAKYYQKITIDVLKRLLITAVVSFFFLNIFDQFWAKAYILALFPVIMGIGYLLNKLAVRKD